MARPAKEGLDYFPLDVMIHEDDKLVVVIGKFGVAGFGIVIRLMMEIYKNGYFYPWTEREQYTFSNRVSVDINTVSSVVSECIKWGFFNNKLFDDHAILTSAGFQRRYLMAVKRRVKTIIQPEHMLLTEKEVSEIKNKVSASKNEVSDGIMQAESTQKKVKEKKVNKTKEKRTYPPESSAYRMASYLHQKIMIHAEESGVGHLVRNADLQKWADDCRKLLEIDNVDPKLAAKVIDWVTADKFWKTNVLSASKLREKFKELAIKMSTGGGKPSAGNGQESSSVGADGAGSASLSTRFTKTG